MGDIILLQNLRRKRAYLQGQIEAKECQLGCLRGDLETIDKMLRLIDAGIDPTAIKGIQQYRRIEGFRQGDLTRLCFAILREAGEALSATQIAQQVAERKDAPCNADLVIPVRANLMRLAREGRLRKEGVRRALKWGLPMSESEISVNQQSVSKREILR